MKVPIPLLLAAFAFFTLACGGKGTEEKGSVKAGKPRSKLVSVTPTKSHPAPAPLPIAPMHAGRVPQVDAVRDAAAGYRPAPAEYGEPDWDHVRLIVAEHLALAGRDLSRQSASRGDWKECARRYLEAASSVESVPLTKPAVTPVRDVLLAGLRRDAAVCDALASGRPPATSAGFTGFRSRYFGLVQRAEHGDDVRDAAESIGQELDAATAGSLAEEAPPASAAPAAQALWLARRWDDTVDPLVVSEPWGPWTVDERPRQIRGLRVAIDALAAGESTGLHLRPAAALARQATDWSTEEFVRTPLADAWGDVGGFAIPHAIRRLQESAAEAEARAAGLKPLLERWPTTREGELPRAVAGAITRYQALPEGLRYFYTLSVQNAAVRQLARDGHFLLAAEIVASQRPARALDWYAPDRAAVILALEGRLRVLAADKEAEARLRASIAESRAFLAFIDRCQAPP